MMHHYTVCVCVYKSVCDVRNVTLRETFNRGCDIDREHSNAMRALDTACVRMMIYHQIEFGCRKNTLF